MQLIGLTGSIGMGKSETAKMFVRLGIPVYDADAAVHELYAAGGAAVAPIAAAFPGAIKNNAVDRDALANQVLKKPAEIEKLEAIVHPLVRRTQQTFLERAKASGAKIAVLDIPLLFETGGAALVDIIVVVSAPYAMQRDRVLERPGMTAEKFEAIIARQVPDSKKTSRADYVVDTSKGLDHAFEQVKAIVAAVKQKNP